MGGQKGLSSHSYGHVHGHVHGHGHVGGHGGRGKQRCHGHVHSHGHVGVHVVVMCGGGQTALSSQRGRSSSCTNSSDSRT
eukprot:3498488-Rhodomonas_salina.1